MTIRTALLAASTLAAAPAPAQAPANPHAALFGAREGVRQISLSPDGKRIAVVAPVPGGTAIAVLVVETAGGPMRSVLRSSGTIDELRSCAWSTSTRLLCTASITRESGVGLIGFSRTVSLNHDGSDLKVLSAPTSSRALGLNQHGGTVIDWQGDADGSVLMTREHVPEESTGTHISKRRSGLGVDRVDTTSLKRSVVETPNIMAVEYITDGQGQIRIRGLRPNTSTGYAGDTIDYHYRAPGSREWRALSKLKVQAQGTSAGFNPYTVDPKLNVAYGFEKLDGREALYRVSLDGNLTRELVFAHGQVDVNDLIRIGRQHRVVGVSYATDHRHAEFFDPELKRLRASLSKALPGLPLVSFVDASADERKLLLWAGSDVDPGRYYLYHKDTRELNELLAVRPQLAATKLSPVKPVSYPAADGTAIPGYLTLPPGTASAKGLPAIVMPHGGPGARDEWGFDWLAQYFAARGFAVLQPNFRGSTGYGDKWFQRNGFQSWRTAIGDVNDGGRWLVKQGGADPAKLAVFGWSYGGYATLQSPALDPDLFKAIVAVAPVTDLESLRREAENYSSYALVNRFIGTGPHVRQGSPAQNARAIKAPVLLFHGDKDQNVGVGESRLMADRLRDAGKKVEYVEYKGLNHYLDDDRVRGEMLGKSDAFLRAALGL